MLRRIWICSSLLTFLLALPALAGDDVKAMKNKGDEQSKAEQSKSEKLASEKCTMSAQECLNQMAAKFKSSGWLGIEYEPTASEEQGNEYWTITKVVPGSPAEAGGLLPGDIVFAMYGIEFSKANETKMKEARGAWKPGQEVIYSVKRAGAEQQITVTLAAWPADVVAQWIGKHMMEHAQVAEDVAATGN